MLHADNCDIVLTTTRGKRQGENLRVSDENTITGSTERVRFTEALFLPSFPARSQRIHDTSFQLHEVQHWHPQSFAHHCRVISGTTMSQWNFERMTMESTTLAPSTPNFHMSAPPE